MNFHLRGTPLLVATAAGVYSVGVLLGCFAVGIRPDSTFRTGSPITPPPRAAASAQPGSPSADFSAPLGASNATPPMEALVGALQKKEFDFEARFFDLHDELCDLVSKVAAEDFPRLWQILRDSKSPAIREFIRYDVLGAWAKLDPAGAVAAAQTLSDPTVRESTVASLLGQWGLTDLEGALQSARQLDGEGPRAWAVACIVLRLAEAAPEKAAGLLEQIQQRPARDRAASSVVGGLAGRDPAGAMAIAEQIRSSTDRCLAFSYIAEALVADGPDKALAWAQDLKNPTDRTTVLYKVLAEITRSDPERALAVLMAQPAQSRDELAGTLAYTWAGQDFQAAARWACQLPAGEMQHNALRDIVRSCSGAEELQSASQLLLSVADGPVRNETLKELGQQWQRTALLDSRSALELARPFAPGPDRDAFLAGACAELEGNHPQQAAQLAQAMTTPERKMQSAEAAASIWSEADPDGAAAWAENLTAGDLQNRVLGAVSKRWGAIDPEATGQWLQTMPAGASRAAAVEAFIDSALSARPDLAAAWLPAVTEETARARLALKVTDRWLQKEPAAARAWLERQRPGNASGGVNN